MTLRFLHMSAFFICKVSTIDLPLVINIHSLIHSLFFCELQGTMAIIEGNINT